MSPPKGVHLTLVTSQDDRGRLIFWFRVPFDRSAWRTLALSAVAVALPAAGYFHRQSRWRTWDLGWPALWLVLALIQTLRRIVKFHENGVMLPATDDRKARSRFLTWRQIERFHFDGNVLDIEGTTDTLKGGPVVGATFKVPSQYQAQVMSILAQNIR